MARPHTTLWDHGWVATVVVLVAVCASWWFTDRYQLLERRWYDQMVAATHPATSPDLAVITIDDPSLATLGPWPWSREILARMIDTLTMAGTRSIVLTVPLSGPEGEQALAQLQRIAGTVTEDPELAAHPRLPGLLMQAQEVLDSDTRLASSLRYNGHVLLTAPIARPAGASGSIAVQWPLSVLEAAAFGTGHDDWQPDSDGVVRGMQPLLDVTNRQIKALALWIWADARGVGLDQLQIRLNRREMQLGTHSAPLDAQGRMRAITGSGGPGQADILRISAHTLLAGKVPPRTLAGKIVLVGITTPTLVPLLRTPNDVQVAPVDALASTAAGLVSGQLVRSPVWGDLLAVSLLLCIGAYLVLLAPQLAQVSSLALSSLLGTALLVGSHLAFTQSHVWLPPMLPLLGLLAGHLTLAAWQQARLRWGPGRVHDHEAGVDESLLREDVPEPLPSIHEPPALQPAEPPTRPPAFEPAVEPTATPTGTPPSSTPQGARWPSLGRFQLDRELGHGAMGRVYLAHELATSRVVVIKTLSLAQEFEGLTLKEARRRFLHEAEAAGRLHHPNIVRIHETGEERGLAYIAMEWLHGRNLVAHTQMNNLLPVTDVLEICARVADALAYAHSQGVIHRDIKPANVMIDPVRGQVTVTDFGIARIIDGRSTRTGLMLGSPLYMSPEQLLGRTIDGRSDLYSLGVMMFQLLTGELPSKGESLAELISAITTQEAPDARRLRPNLPQAVAEVVALALEKQPELRYRNGQDMATDLRLVAASLRDPARPTSAPAARSAASSLDQRQADDSSRIAPLWSDADMSSAIMHNRSG